MKLNCIIICALIVLINYCSMSTSSTCSNGCGVRSYLNDLRSENEKISCLTNKVNSSVNILETRNELNTSFSDILSTRREQLRKLSNAKMALDQEIKILSSKCDNYVGENCNETCFGLTNNMVTVCSGHGKCIDKDNCQCNYNWVGKDCSSLNCLPKSTSICNSTSGVCNCVCDEGFVDANCIIQIYGNDTVGRKFGDGTYATSCNSYIHPSNSSYSYSGSVGNGYYWIKPDSIPIKVFCEMIAYGGGWTGLSSEVIASSLNSGSHIRTYLYAKDSSHWVYTPPTSNIWSRTESRPVNGNYYYSTNNGQTQSFFSCTNSADGMSYAVGCTNGYGWTNKIICSEFSDPNICTKTAHYIVGVESAFGYSSTYIFESRLYLR